MLTQERLKEVLAYDAISGVFTWLVARGRQPIGAIAGCDSHRGYTKIRVDGTEYYTHRAAWLYVHGAWPDADIDHINGNRADNRICNLRAVSRSENLRNSGIPVRNTYGRVGVFWNAGKAKWTARIKLHGRNIHLGHFNDMNAACMAREEAERKYGFHANHGKRKAFSCRNETH